MSVTRDVAIVGGGLAGITAAWQLHRLGHGFQLFEASPRLGGTVETVHQQGFVVECGPDGWVSEKPWARELAEELGLAAELIGSNDATRVTYLLKHGQLVPMPSGMRMMVPTDLALLEGSALFTHEAKQAYAHEAASADSLLKRIPDHDESVATFVERHFGQEVLETLAAPLLSGVFGGDVRTLSVRSVMPAFIRMEREYGSLILALQSRVRNSGAAAQSIFTTLRSGTETLIDRMVAELPPASIHLNSRVTSVHVEDGSWAIQAAKLDARADYFASLILATPAQPTLSLLAPAAPGLKDLLKMEASTAVIACFAFTDPLELPPGFGFLVPEGDANRLLAATFIDQKYPGRVPDGGRLIRGFFGGSSGPSIARLSNDEIEQLALSQLEAILGPLPKPLFSIVRRWPDSLPQYAVGHAERVAAIAPQLSHLPRVGLLGNAYNGVGLPDIIRDARAMAKDFAA